MVSLETILIALSQNIALLFALAFALGLLLEHFDKVSFEISPFISGALFGFIAVIGMLIPIELFPGVILDGSPVIIAVGAVVNGWRSVTAASLITIVARAAMGGAGVFASVATIISSAACGLFLNRRYQHNQQVLRGSSWIYFGLIIATIALFWWFSVPEDTLNSTYMRIGIALYLLYPAGIYLLGTLTDHENRRLLLEQTTRQHAADLEKQVQSRTQELSNALENERTLKQFKSRFDTILMHEFINPLSVIRTAMDVLTKDPKRLADDEGQQMLRNALMQVVSLNELINDLLTLNRAEVAQLELKLEDTDINQLLQTLIDEAKQSTEQTVRLVTDADCGIVSVDVKLLRRAIMNLLANAIKYSPDDAIVTVYLTCDETTYTIVIEDGGIGIPDGESETIFEMFYRGSNTQSISGNGLGLALVKYTAELHGGSVKATNNDEIGASFTITLPRYVPQEPPSDGS